MVNSLHPETIKFFVWVKKHLPEQSNKTPLSHYQMIDALFSGENNIKSYLCSRGLGKTTLLSTVLPLYIAYHGSLGNVLKRSYFCMIVSDTTSQSEAIISDILDVYESSDLKEYGLLLERSVQGEIEFKKGKRKYYVVAKGSGSKLRGLKRNLKRPDVLILDDLSNEDVALNPLRREKLNRWLNKSLLPSREPNNSIVINVFTPLHQSDAPMILHNSKFSDSVAFPIADKNPPHWDSMKPTWKDRFDINFIKRTYDEYLERGRVAEFMQEFFLQLVSDESRIFDVDKIRYEKVRLSQSAMIYVSTDLAISQKESSDRSVACVVAFDRGSTILLDIKSDRYNPTEFMNILFQMNKKYKPLSVGLEMVGYQQAFKHHLEQEMMNRNEYFQIEPLKLNNTVSKHVRIASLQPIISNKNLVINEDLLNSESLERLLEQIELSTREGILSQHDDEVDCLSGVLQLQPVETYSVEEFVQDNQEEDILEEKFFLGY